MKDFGVTRYVQTSVTNGTTNPHPTNGDKIRAASDEEIAEFIINGCLDDKIHFCKSKPECDEILDSGGTITDEMCRKCCIDWLRQPAGGCNT